jgi:hypothetical protein
MSLFSTKEEWTLLNSVGSNNTNNNVGGSTTDSTNDNNRVNPKEEESNLLLVNDDEAWQVYEGIMRQVMTASRVLKKDKLESMKPVHDFILSNHPARFVLPPAPTSSGNNTEEQPIPTVGDDGATAVEEIGTDNNDNNNNNNTSSTTTSSSAVTATHTTTMRAQLNLQRRTFTEAFQWTLAQYDYAVRCFTYMGDFCAKNQTATRRGQGGGGGGGNPIVVAWHKLRECGMIPKENCISTYMYVLSLEEEDNHDNNDNSKNDSRNDVSSSPRSNTYNKNNNSANSVLMEVATFHDLLFPPNEKTITLRIKSLIAQGNVQEAEAILQSLPVSVYEKEWVVLPT